MERNKLDVFFAEFDICHKFSSISSQRANLYAMIVKQFVESNRVFQSYFLYYVTNIRNDRIPR